MRVKVKSGAPIRVKRLKKAELLNFRGLRIGYVPMSNSLNSPGDKRRFAYYARRRGLTFEIADPEKKYDLIVITQNADISIWRKYDRSGARIVYDLIDSYLAIPRSNIKGQIRGLAKYASRKSRYLQLDHWKAISEMCVRADAVICSTREQRDDILRFCDNVHIVLDAHMGVTKKIKTDYSSSTPFRIVWEGLPQNLGSLELISPMLNKLKKKYPIEFHVVTDPFYKRYLNKYVQVDSLKVAQSIFPGVHFHEWQEVNCAEIICSCDLAVIPLDLNDTFAAGKPENKLLLFWRMAMPVLTSATPAYARAMKAASLDCAVKDDIEWLDVLEKLIVDKDARRRIGEAGKKYVDSEFSEASILSRWDVVLSSLSLGAEM